MTMISLQEILRQAAESPAEPTANSKKSAELARQVYQLSKDAVTSLFGTSVGELELGTTSNDRNLEFTLNIKQGKGAFALGREWFEVSFNEMGNVTIEFSYVAMKDKAADIAKMNQPGAIVTKGGSPETIELRHMQPHEATIAILTHMKSVSANFRATLEQRVVQPVPQVA